MHPLSVHGVQSLYKQCNFMEGQGCSLAEDGWCKHMHTRENGVSMLLALYLLKNSARLTKCMPCSWI